MSNRHIETQSWVKGAFYLSIAAIIAKGLSAIYKIPYQNIAGDTGFYVYQQVYPIYGIVFVLGSYGFPMVIARMIAEDEMKYSTVDNTQIRQRIMFVFVCLFLFLGAIGTFVIASAEMIATFMGDPKLSDAIRWMGAPFFLIPFLAVGRGIYQGFGNTIPTAVSQVMEQVIRVGVILVIAVWAMNQDNPYLAGTSAGIGAFIGGVTGMVILALPWRREEKFPLLSKTESIWSIPTTWRQDMKALLVTGVLVSISAMALVIFQFIDSFTLLRLLEANGWPLYTATIEKGVYDRGWPLIQFGAVVTTVFSYAVIPFLTRSYHAGKINVVKEELAKALKVCLVFGGAATIGMAIIMPSLNSMMFTDEKGTIALQILSFVVLFGALFMTVAALLHAIGKAAVSAMILLVGIAVKTILNIWLIPIYGIVGAAWSSTGTFAAMALLSLLLLVKYRLWQPFTSRFWLRWIESLFIMGLIVATYQRLFNLFFSGGRGTDTLNTISAVLLGGLIFIFMIWKRQLFSKRDWENLPIISKIFRYGKH